jgi:hypothetical protein
MTIESLRILAGSLQVIEAAGRRVTDGDHLECDDIDVAGFRGSEIVR